MSSLIGLQGERWSLARAIDALRDSARQAGRPGLVWVIGIVNPSVAFGLSWLPVVAAAWTGQYALDDAGPAPMAVSPTWLMHPLAAVPSLTFMQVCLGLFCFPLFRLVAGLARVSPAAAWTEACAGRRSPRIRTLWKNGSGMTLSVIGLWLLLVVTVSAALIGILVPAELIVRPIMHGGFSSNFSGAALAVLLLSPLALVFVAYALSIAVLTQLALHSLAHNRRGIGSALLHSWRIMRHDVPATTRAVVVDVVLTVAIILFTTMLSSLSPFAWLDVVIGLTLTGFAGVTRAAYWARAYRALGGLSPDDGVPGLPQASARDAGRNDW
ncbi:MAG: hypothetical protein JNL28_04510 [Planctomycetes bacterium]|nr:hypothetical protein [Planctomycetota bacterium]